MPFDYKTSATVHNLSVCESFQQLKKNECLPKMVVYRGKFLYAIPTKTLNGGCISKINIIFNNILAKFLGKIGIISFDNNLVKPLVAEVRQYVLSLAERYEGGLNERITILKTNVGGLEAQHQELTDSVNLLKRNNESSEARQQALSSSLATLRNDNINVLEKNVTARLNLEGEERKVKEQQQSLEKIERAISEKQILYKEVVATQNQLSTLKQELELTSQKLSQKQVELNQNYNSGLSEGRSRGDTEGYNRGKEEGYNRGKEEGENSGFVMGYSAGFAEGQAR